MLRYIMDTKHFSEVIEFFRSKQQFKNNDENILKRFNNIIDELNILLLRKSIPLKNRSDEFDETLTQIKL